MNYVHSYGQLVSRYAGRLTDNPQSREDFCQDAYMRIHQLSELYPEDSKTQSEFWRRQVHVAIRNLMLDAARKNNTRRRYYGVLDPDKGDGIENRVDSSQNQFEKLAVKNAIEELQRLLPEDGVRVLREIIQPSEAFTKFLANKRSVQSIWNKTFGVKLEGERLRLVADPAIAEYLQMKPEDFKRYVAKINFLVTHVL